MPTLTVRMFLISFATLATLHFLLLQFYLYWRHTWLDIPMHLFGGAVVVLGIYSARDLSIPFFSRITRLWHILLIVFLVAVLWEVFEFSAGISVYTEYFWVDTLLDLCVGMVGAGVGTVIAKRLDTLSL